MVLDTSSWPGLQLVEQMKDGNRNEVWRGELDGLSVAVRQSARSPASLDWELDLITFLETQGFAVPTIVPAETGARSSNGVVVQSWLVGREPSTEADWRAVATELSRLHQTTANYEQRPGCCSINDLPERRRSVDADLDALPPDVCQEILAVFAAFTDVPIALIHGDPHGPNLRIMADGIVGLLDWDESRVDATWHDLSNLGIQVLADRDHVRAQRLSHAWEAANGWLAEPSYAQARLEELRRLQ